MCVMYVMYIMQKNAALRFSALEQAERRLRLCDLSLHTAFVSAVQRS